MNNRVNYTIVGLAVIFGMILIVGFSYWLLKPSANEEVTQYSILFDESILGLNVDSDVEYRGIKVGKVAKLRINPKNIEQVEVIITIFKTTPIRENTVAKLTSQGITGLSYINLSRGANDSAILKPKDGEKYAVIKTAPSFFNRFEKSLETVSDELSTTLIKTSNLLNNENQKQVAMLLSKSASFMDKMDRLLDDKTIKSFHDSINNFDMATQKINNMVPRVDNLIDNSIAWEDKISTSFGSISNSYLGIRSSMDEIKRAISSGEFNIKAITKDFMPIMNNTLIEMQYMMIEMQNTMNQYNRSPSDIIFKQEKIKKGPGEK